MNKDNFTMLCDFYGAGKSMYTTALYAQDEININEHFQAYAGPIWGPTQ